MHPVQSIDYLVAGDGIVAVKAKPMLIGDVARSLGVPPWRVRRLFTHGILPEPARMGPNRVFRPKDVVSIRKALRESGHLPAASRP
jgi:hypothetical protein